MMWIFKRLRRSQRGQTLVEFALILPILILILFGILEFGRIFYSYISITNAVREGARIGVVGAEDDEIIAKVKAAAHLKPEIQEDEIKILPEETHRTPGVALSVEVSYNVDLVTPLFSKILDDPFPLNSKAVMRVE